MSLAFLAIGDELLTGRVLDRHLLQVGRDLAVRGLALRGARVVPDRVESIREALAAESAGGARTIIVTGGLGPTPDDVTREALALWAGVPLEDNVLAREQVFRQVTARGREPVAADCRLAALPVGAEVLENRAGTAPGLLLVGPGGVTVWALPGVPVEFRQMWSEEVLPRLMSGHVRHVALRVLRTSGAGEREVAEILRELALG
ncbi:MAG: molybdopterin-binding protein, partial [Candidatus Sericytochromatia bacterium]|nr:molybdopterin-binding protein [Candidatus Sericytochromatia bacterium]